MITACSIAQPFERVDVVNVDSTRSAAELYRTAERWFVDSFKDAQEVIQLRDTVTHTLIGKGAKAIPYVVTKPAYASAPMAMRYSVEVSTKKGRYRMRIYDVTIETVEYLDNDTACLSSWASYTPKKYSNAHKNAVKSQTDLCSAAKATLETLSVSLKAAMLKPKDDW
jgi:hypothetical protein